MNCVSSNKLNSITGMMRLIRNGIMSILNIEFVSMELLDVIVSI